MDAYERHCIGSLLDSPPTVQEKTPVVPAKPTGANRVRTINGATIVNGINLAGLKFVKPMPQCYQWNKRLHQHEQPNCRLWHPRELCKYYPTCHLTAEVCGFGHPFCSDDYCRCIPERRDKQLNHRLMPAHIRRMRDPSPIATMKLPTTPTARWKPILTTPAQRQMPATPNAMWKKQATPTVNWETPAKPTAPYLPPAASRVRMINGATIVNGINLAGLKFLKPAKQCHLWDDKAHLAKKGCRLWHPRELCKYYPTCHLTAEVCGFGHPFCSKDFCKCHPERRDKQLNHRC